MPFQVSIVEGDELLVFGKLTYSFLWKYGLSLQCQLYNTSAVYSSENMRKVF